VERSRGRTPGEEGFDAAQGNDHAITLKRAYGLYLEDLADIVREFFDLRVVVLLKVL
jgi:hypothetical protein